MASITTLFRISVMPLAIAVTASCSSCEKKPTPEPQPKLPENLVTNLNSFSYSRPFANIATEFGGVFNYASDGKDYRLRTTFTDKSTATGYFKFQKPNLTDANSKVEVKYDKYGYGYLSVTNLPTNQITVTFNESVSKEKSLGVKEAKFNINSETVFELAADQHKETEAAEWEGMTQSELLDIVENFHADHSTGDGPNGAKPVHPSLY